MDYWLKVSGCRLGRFVDRIAKWLHALNDTQGKGQVRVTALVTQGRLAVRLDRDCFTCNCCMR